MKRYNFIGVIIVVVLMTTLFSCVKEPEEKLPNSNEAIFFNNIDSIVIEKKAGEELEIEVQLTTDTIIDSLLVGYLIDTFGLTTNVKYSDITTVVAETEFLEKENWIKKYNVTVKLPSNVYGVRAFKPFIDGKGDYVRIIFRMVAGSNSYEKQLKVIIEP